MTTTAPPRHAAPTRFVPHDESPRKRWVVYGVVIAAVLVLLGVMIGFYRGHEENQQALAKADQLIASMQQAGYPTLDREEVAGVLGTDGGAVCQTSASDLGKAALRLGLVNGAAQTGVRPVTVSQRVVQGERLIVQTYCPEKLAAFDTVVSQLDYANVIKS
jgi:hypothetical protein